MKKRLIRLTEGDLHRIVKEALDKASNEKSWIPELEDAWYYLECVFKDLERAEVEVEGVQEILDKILDAKVSIKHLIDRINGDNIPTDEGPRPY